MTARARYDDIADDLAARDPSIELGQMMGMPCIKAGGKMIIGYESSGEMVFKLPDPKEHEWVQVPAAHESEWSGLAQTTIRLRAG